MREVLQRDASSVVEAAQAVLPSGTPELAVEIALALLVLAVGWYLSKLAVRVAGRTVARRIERPSVTRTVLRGVRLVVLLWAIGVAAGILASATRRSSSR